MTVPRRQVSRLPFVLRHWFDQEINDIVLCIETVRPRIGFEDHERQPVDFRPSYIIFSELGRRSISAVLQTITCERSNVVHFFWNLRIFCLEQLGANTAVFLPEQS